MKFVASSNTSEVLEPREQSFDFRATSIPTQRTAILSGRYYPIDFMRSNKFYSLSSKSLIESLFDKGDFMWASRSRVDGDRKASAVCHCHELRTLAALGFSSSGAPFFATTKVASIKHSVSLNLPRFSRSWARVSRMWRNTLARTHSWNRRWQVWYGGKRSGISHHRAPVRRTQRIPLMTGR